MSHPRQANLKALAFRALSMCTALVLAIAALSPAARAAASPETVKGSKAKNVILFIADGMSVGGYTLARWYQGGQALATDALVCGMVQTYAADSAITDSAPGGSAFSTGYKSHTGYVGVLPDENTMPGMNKLKEEDRKRPVATVLEAAKLSGKSTGIVMTCEFMHATPADFASHYPDRKNYTALTEQIVYNNLDVVLGGGRKFMTDREDGEDMIEAVKERGYQYITTRSQLLDTKGEKLFGLFAEADLAYDFERQEEEPSLAEMTQAAINTLSQNEKGFFLMVEGSKVDWAAHANDPVGIVSDILSFDKAVEAGLAYAKEQKDTVVIVTTDHGNSGITIGNQETTTGYDKIHIDEYVKPLKAAKYTGEGAEKMLNEERSNIESVMKEYYGISNLTPEEIAKIKEAEAGTLNYTVGPMMAERAKIGFTTGGHTGEDVILGVYAPDGIRPTGVIDNTDIASYIANTLEVDLATANAQLFLKAEAVFAAKGAKVKLDETDPKNPVLQVEKGSQKLDLPLDKSVGTLNGKPVQLQGLVVYNTLDVYVPQDAVDLIR